MTSRLAIKRWILVASGLLSLALGLLGIVLPGLPTTPFVLLAAACFANASPRLHRWLLNHRQLGPMVRDWEAHRSLPLPVKWLATGMMTGAMLLSAWRFNGRTWMLMTLLGLGALGVWVVWRIPTRPRIPARGSNPSPFEQDQV